MSASTRVARAGRRSAAAKSRAERACRSAGSDASPCAMASGVSSENSAIVRSRSQLQTPAHELVSSSPSRYLRTYAFAALVSGEKRYRQKAIQLAGCLCL